MSQYRDGSFYDGSSEEDSDHGYKYEPYVPKMTDRPTPDFGGQPPVLISNADLLEQLYRMGDALNGFDSRLSTVERRKARRGLRRSRATHAPGKAPMIDRDALAGHGRTEGGRVPITPRRLDYSNDTSPIIELVEEDADGREILRADNREATHPHRSLDRYGRGYGNDRWRRPQCRGRGGGQGRYFEGYHRDNYHDRLDSRWNNRADSYDYAEHDDHRDVENYDRGTARGRGQGQGENQGRNQGRNPEIIVIPEDAQNANQQQAPPGGNQVEAPPLQPQGPQPQMQTIPGVGTFNVGDLKRLLNYLEGRVMTTPEIPSPFSAAVREAQLPAGYRNTTSDLRFHRNLDPVEFLGRFNIEMDVYQVSDLARCRLLVATFRESAQQWFQKLGPGVITSWDQMKTLFLTKFQAAVRYVPSVTTLANVRQRENESLISYFKRFNAESTSVRGTSDEALQSFLIAGLRVGSDFWKHLQGKDPATLADVFALAESFKAIEQSLAEVQLISQSSQRSKGRKRDRSPSPRYKRSSRSPDRINTASTRRGWSPPSNYDYRTSWYTPLVASIEHIYEVNKNKGLFRKPEALSSWQSKDKKIYCEYHESSGHNTHECRHLKDEIEVLIKEGYLGEWVVKEVRKHKDDRAKEEERRAPRRSNNDTLEENKFVRDGSIRTIYEGDPGMECSNRGLARYAREARFRPLTDIHRVETRPPKVFKGESMDITFREADARWVHHPHNVALVISIQIRTKNVHRASVDNGSSANILYYNTFKKMGLPDQDISGEDSWVYGFSGVGVRVMGSIRLPCTLGESPLSVTKKLEFKVLNQESSHNLLLGRPFMREMRVITSIHHLTIKFPTPNGVGSIKGSQYDSRECYRQAMRGFRKDSHAEDILDVDQEKSIEQPIEEIRVHYYVEQEDEHPSGLPPTMLYLEDTIRIEMLEEEEAMDIVVQTDFNGERLEGRFDVLQSLEHYEALPPEGAPLPAKHTKEVDAPAMQDAPSKEVDAPPKGDAPSLQDNEIHDSPDLDPRILMPMEKMGPAKDTIEILVDEKDPSKVLRIGSQLAPRLKEGLSIFLLANLDVFAWNHSDMAMIYAFQRAIALAEEVARLLDVGLIRESFYPEWLANPVLVKKPNGKWRTCMDFTDLNKACPKDSFPLPRIDQLIDATAGHALLSFMDAYSGYNQILMYEPDQEHTSFITDRGLYCYIGMPFGLINAGATYQRLVNKMFKKQIRKTMEVYMDDMLVKSKRAEDHIADLAEMFHILRKYKMKLNPQKCVFGVESGKFLGFMVNHRGIEANPAKIKALLDMKSPTSVKQVQSLTGRIAALNRFVSKSSDRCKEFFKAIKGRGKDFLWTPECEEAFLKIKEQLGNPPMLTKLEDGETLIIYLVVSEYFVSAVLVKEEASHQWPVYYVSKRLLDAETRYTNMEKLVYALILAARKLRPYFQAHRIEVRTAYPLRHILHKPESSGRMLKWAVELGQFDLEYCPRTAIKGQALADFILEFDAEVDNKAIGLAEPTSQGSHQDEKRQKLPHPWWILHVDGAVNNNGSGAGIVSITPEGHRLMSAIHFKFYATNNDVEYEALINGLKLVLEVGAVNLIVRSDSELVVNQTGAVPEDKLQARRLRYQAANYFEYDGGYYWPTMREDAFNFVRACDRCQRFANYSNAPASTITSLASPWPFAMWGIDLIGELSKAKGGVKYAVVDVDYFTKWVEAMPLATIMGKRIRDFVFNSIVCRFGIPYKLISDNGKQFDSKELRKLCEDLKIKKDFAAVYHSQSNGQTEAINKIIKHTLKAKLE
ncbi:uncharacterized protein LOC141714827 [Apium graveolens]|uniref:uncharacterized protein LOC141714827 n=1 Tax=Apium graveolens TaxID=4045 RepID=UPI003D7B52B2